MLDRGKAELMIAAWMIALIAMPGFCGSQVSGLPKQSAQTQAAAGFPSQPIFNWSVESEPGWSWIMSAKQRMARYCHLPGHRHGGPLRFWILLSLLGIAAGSWFYVLRITKLMDGKVYGLAKISTILVIALFFGGCPDAQMSRITVTLSDGTEIESPPMPWWVEGDGDFPPVKPSMTFPVGEDYLLFYKVGEGSGKVLKNLLPDKTLDCCATLFRYSLIKRGEIDPGGSITASKLAELFIPLPADARVGDCMRRVQTEINCCAQVIRGDEPGDPRCLAKSEDRDNLDKAKTETGSIEAGCVQAYALPASLEECSEIYAEARSAIPAEFDPHGCGSCDTCSGCDCGCNGCDGVGCDGAGGCSSEAMDKYKLEDR